MRSKSGLRTCRRRRRWAFLSPRSSPPSFDVFGQLRGGVTDPNGGGGGQTIFKDRGAVDRVDNVGPYAKLLVPLDNDAQDQDPIDTVVHLATDVMERFTILLADGLGDPRPTEGAGVNGSLVNGNSVTVTQNGVALVPNQDFTLGYNPGSNLLSITPLSQLWEPNSVYQITLENQGVNAIQDYARNDLVANQPSGKTQFTIILGDMGLDFGDAPDGRRTLLASDGPRHVILPLAPLYLGGGVDSEANGQPGPLADGDDGDFGVVVPAGTAGVLSTSPGTVYAPDPSHWGHRHHRRRDGFCDR